MERFGDLLCIAGKRSRHGVLVLPRLAIGITLAKGKADFVLTQLPELLRKLVDMPAHQVQGFGAVGGDGQRHPML